MSNSGKLLRFLALLSGISFAIAPASAQNALYGTEARKRAEALLKQMTVDEKVGQMNQAAGILLPGLSEKPDAMIAQGRVGSILWLNQAKEINRLQHIAVEKTRLHIPLLFGLDVIHGYRTTFPVPLAMASSWDPMVEEQAQRFAAADARAAGIRFTFTPMVDIARDARWGRIVEGAGEDPYLGAAMARAQVRGFQGAALGETSVLACVKHFAAYGAAEGGRDYDSAYVPEELLRNVYLPPFHAALKQGAGSIMSAYMDLNDVPATGNRWLLTDLLRDEWGFRGFVVSDALAVMNLVTHGFASDPSDAAFKAVIAGVDMEMGTRTFIENLAKLVAAGKVSEARLDAAVLPILAIKYQLGIFEHPYADESRTEETLNRPEGRALERKLASRSMVLLKNDDRVLPLKSTVNKIAVIGPLADSATNIEGGWTAETLFGGPVKSHPVSVLAGIRNRIGGSARIAYVGAPMPERLFPGPFDMLSGRKPPPPPTEAEVSEILAKVKAAAMEAEVVIAVLGETSAMSSEGASRASLNLPGIQERMLEAAVASGKPVVVVLVSGRPLDIRWAAAHVQAILEAWYPGTEGGNAIADVLFGDVNPGGKLPVTWPRTAGQEPLYYNHNLTHDPENGPRFTSRYWDLASSPLYPFGFGLSYTTFEFANLRLSKTSIRAEETTEVAVDVKNTGPVDGDEVAQVYIHQQSGSASRPVRELKGFQRVTLKPGETKSLTFPLGKDELQFWSPQAKKWVVEPAVFDVWVGGDSAAKLHADFRVVTP